MPVTIMVGRAQIPMAKLSRVEYGLSHQLSVCLGYTQPRPEYSCFVATARMGSREAIFPKLLQVDNDRLCWMFHQIGFSSSASAAPALVDQIEQLPEPGFCLEGPDVPHGLVAVIRGARRTRPPRSFPCP